MIKVKSEKKKRKKKKERKEKKMIESPKKARALSELFLGRKRIEKKLSHNNLPDKEKTKLERHLNIVNKQIFQLEKKVRAQSS